MIIVIISILFILPVMNVVDAFNLDPKETIRLRVIPNSNTIRDQAIKYKVRKVIEEDLAKSLSEANDKEMAKEMTKERMPELERKINRILRQNNVRHRATIEYGISHFPRTTDYGIIFPAGNYEGIVVTIGKGRGSNWWCILFPPHCLIEAEVSEQIEYRSFFKDLIKRINQR